MSSSRKRVISSCIPCYTRKQKVSLPPPLHVVVEPRKDRDGSEKKAPPRATHSPRDEWCESFGYFQDSNTNTLALIQKASTCHDESPPTSSLALGPEAASEVLRVIERMPDRQVLDFLVYFFATELCWIDQLVHVPWLLEKYQRWNAAEGASLAPDVEFVVLILRICSYALQFLPSPAYPLDRIRGELLADLRKACNDAADRAEAISAAADGRGSPIRVQHLAFLGLRYQAEGKMRAYAEALGRAIRVAQNIGMHCDVARPRGEGASEADREMARRIFCNLYISDSLLSRRLDCAPFLPGRLAHGGQPQPQLLEDHGKAGGPPPPPAGHRSQQQPQQQRIDPFDERLLQARLADFWRSVSPPGGIDYDAMAAEERYDKFCREFLPQLPPAFALSKPDESWDKQFPRLPLQRKLLHTAIYDSLCWNFRPLLLRQPSSPLPAYKAVLLGFQKKTLAVAALRSLDSVGQLHALLGGRHTRLTCIVVSTFEAAVLLLSLLADPSFPGEPQRHDAPPHETDPLQAGIPKLSRSGCLQAVQGGLDRLKMLAEVSNMADLGAGTLGQLLGRVPEGDGGRRLSAAASDVATPGTQEDGASGKESGETTLVSAAGGLPASWVPGGSDPPDHRLAVDFTSGGGAGTSPAIDVSQWLSFDAASIATHTQSGDFWSDIPF
ncbi:uncharacterized protein LY79DRAFT_511381 [Colletotrichum navitas]|uniref:Xylanolytic transcriptional activator regulatory domain-containing protein n=1 Tax=Colletotrichum navitas TaxID=681940 RepID=A0AAD8Q3S5_9PEZI|nr:uncharacterized protein LY79DRAFT_511381 [Colletotrichum navitas]KAK1595298.1 hypothetical protein LY79DRAFT_511381 [Colletotrichum navitas]